MFSYYSERMSILQISNYNMDLQLFVDFQLVYWTPEALMRNIFFYLCRTGETV